MTGRRLPLAWSHQVRSLSRYTAFTLLDAAAFASTAALDLADGLKAPDFTVISFYKIFGYPHIGALIVRKDIAYVFRARRYFGGGTVDMVGAFMALGRQASSVDGMQNLRNVCGRSLRMWRNNAALCSPERHVETKIDLFDPPLWTEAVPRRREAVLPPFCTVALIAALVANQFRLPQEVIARISCALRCSLMYFVMSEYLSQ